MDVYQKSPGESNSLLSLIARSPLRYRMTRDGILPAREPTHDMQLGTLIHSAVNEGQEPAFHLRPDSYGPENKKWNMNANECKAWVAARKDKPILDAYDALMLNSVTACVKDNRRAMKLLRGAHTEVSACAYNEDMSAPYMLRVRFDVLGHDEKGWYWVETKSTRDASTFAFSLEILKKFYHVQTALYRRVLRRLTGEEPRCYMMPIEKDAAIPRVNVRQLASAAMDKGDAILDERLALLRRCKLANKWPALVDEEEGDNIPFIDLPDHAYGKVDDLKGMTETENEEEA